MLNNKDPLISAVQKVMQDSYSERNAVKIVNEKFGVVDRRVLPRERQDEWDAVYQTVLSEGVKALDEKLIGKQHKIDKNKNGRIDSQDFDMMKEGNVDTVGKGENEGGSAVTTDKPKATAITSPQQAALKKKIQSIKEAKKAAMCEATLESIQEEIANNLAEQASYIYENEGVEGLNTFLESLTEEQIAILEQGGLWDTIKGAANSAADAVSSAARSAEKGMGQLATATGATAANKWLRRKAADTATAVLGPERSASLQSFVKGTSVGKERKQELQKGNMSSSEYKAGPRDTSGSTAPTPKPKPTAPKAVAPKAAAPKSAAPKAVAPEKKSTPVTRMKHNRMIDKGNEVGPRAKYQGLGVTTGTTIKK